MGQKLTSATRRLSTPYTLSWSSTTPPRSLGIMAAVQHSCPLEGLKVCRTASLISSSDCTSGPNGATSVGPSTLIDGAFMISRAFRTRATATSRSDGSVAARKSTSGFARGSVELMLTVPRLKGLKRYSVPVFAVPQCSPPIDNSLSSWPSMISRCLVYPATTAGSVAGGRKAPGLLTLRAALMMSADCEVRFCNGREMKFVLSVRVIVYGPWREAL